MSDTSLTVLGMTSMKAHVFDTGEGRGSIWIQLARRGSIDNSPREGVSISIHSDLETCNAYASAINTVNDRETVDVYQSQFTEETCPSHIASKADPKICARCGTHIDNLRVD